MASSHNAAQHSSGATAWRRLRKELVDSRDVAVGDVPTDVEDFVQQLAASVDGAWADSAKRHVSVRTSGGRVHIREP